MKLLITGLFFLLSIQTFCQRKINDIEAFYKDIESILEDSTRIDSMNTISDKPNIKSKFWSHTVYNPYKEIKMEFPLKLTFKDSTYGSPIGKHKIVTSRYGWRRGREHKGIDIDLITGDSIFAMFDGVVRMSRYTSGHGRTVVVRHYNGLETVYAHLSKYGVKENDTVYKGDYLGKGGTSGNARGSHLHLVINYKGVSINPEYLFKFDANNTIRSKELWVTKKWTQPVFHNSKRQSPIKPLLTREEALASLIKQRSIYVVKPGDTLSRISANNNVTIASICKLNSIRKSSVIKIGQKLLIEK
ncbi:M23 family metallopeptidase [Seonamhaeicola aphaedonensis]|uniref:LysM domain-containing protein n=1 Tax=Seonamhaeicola aphaedonensis TaxID=1461338 RepID=A0A3D9HJJ7_9FLAO|nr:M23 family metallopeptidase [Seonamhaeicola aphaedonensis]RED49461.1 LysM domain-containing protein [Seonamhaeicola aphaedonensis]